MASYLKNKELLKEVIECKSNNNILSKKLVNYFILMCNNIALKFKFTIGEAKADAIQDALIVLLRNWHGFDEVLYTNPFAYYTEIIKRSFAMTYNQNKKSKNNIELSEIYNI